MLRRLAVLHQRGPDEERVLVRGFVETMLGEMLEFGAIDPQRVRRASAMGLVLGALAPPSAPEGPLLRWPVPFDRVEFYGYDVAVIADSDSLRDEGCAMEHCVANFSERCHAGEWLVCSIRAPDQDGARWTAACYRRDGRWHLDGIRGRRNALPPDALLLVGHAIAETLDAAARLT